MSNILENIQKMVELAQEIQAEDEVVGNVFMMNIMNSMDIIQAKIKGESIDISEKIKIVCECTGLDLEEFIKEIIKNDFSGSIVTNEEVDKDVLDFIINNSQDVEQNGEAT